MNLREFWKRLFEVDEYLAHMSKITDTKLNFTFPYCRPFHAINCMAFPQREENAYQRFIVSQAIHPRLLSLDFLAWIS